MNKAWPLVLAVSSLVATVAASNGVGRLPAKLAGYRSWMLTAKPREIPRERSMACLPPSLFDHTRKSHGPHAWRWIRVTANATAAAAMKKTDGSEFPAGSVIVKEKLHREDDSSPEGLAFMIKHEKGKFAASGGWEFLYYPKTNDTDAYAGCVACHRGGAKRDYVFGTFEPEEEGE